MSHTETFFKPNIFETDTETFFETDTKTYFLTKIFRDRYWDFFRDQSCRDQYRYYEKMKKVSIPRSLETRCHTLGRTPGNDRLEINQGVIARSMWDEIAQWLVFAKHLLWCSIKDITNGKMWPNKHLTCVQFQRGQKCIHPTSTILEIVAQRISNNV